MAPVAEADEAGAEHHERTQPDPGDQRVVVQTHRPDILALALIIFGPGKLPDVGRAVGKAMSEFKNASREIEQEIKK